MTSNDNIDPKRNDLERFVGRAIAAIGVLWIALSGLCTLVALVNSLRTNGEAVWVALEVGGISVAIGFLLYWLGRRIIPRGDR